MIHAVIPLMRLGGRLEDLLYMVYVHPALPEILRNAARKARPYGRLRRRIVRWAVPDLRLALAVGGAAAAASSSLEYACHSLPRPFWTGLASAGSRRAGGGGR